MAKDFPSRTARIILSSMIVVFVLLRLFLHTFSTTNLDIGPYNVHHLFIGILLVIGAGLPLILKMPRGTSRWVLASILGAGLALILDEWVYLIITDGSDASYLLPESVIGAAILMAIVAVYIVALAKKRQ